VVTVLQLEDVIRHLDSERVCLLTFDSRASRAAPKFLNSFWGRAERPKNYSKNFSRFSNSQLAGHGALATKGKGWCCKSLRYAVQGSQKASMLSCGFSPVVYTEGCDDYFYLRQDDPPISAF